MKSNDCISPILRLYDWFMELVKPGSKLSLQLVTNELCLSSVLVPGVVTIAQNHINILHLLGYHKHRGITDLSHVIDNTANQKTGKLLYIRRHLKGCT